MNQPAKVMRWRPLIEEPTPWHERAHRRSEGGGLVTGGASLLLAFALVVACGDWVAVHHGAKGLEYVCKPLTMVLLVGTALALDPADPTVRAWFVAALLFSLAGDVFLMLPQDLFVFGLGAFLLGHLAYIVGMQVDGVDGLRFLVGIGIVAVLLAVIGTAVLRGVRTGPDPALAGPVVAYMVVISAMVASAIGVGNPAAIVGAALFYVSDSLIAWNRFLRETSARTGRDHGHVPPRAGVPRAQPGVTGSDAKRLSPSASASRRVSSWPRTLLPAASSGGEKRAERRPCPGDTVTMPPLTPLLPGRPTSYSQSPERS